MELSDSQTIDQGLSPTKRAVLALLKRTPGASLRDLATELGISRAGAIKHLSRLEGSGLVAREYRAGKLGRPRVCFRLAPAAQRIFPAAYTEAALTAMRFIEQHQGRAAVVQMLEERAAELRERHSPRLSGKDLSERIRELNRIRDQEGYMSELRRPRAAGTELLEHNCPILAIAENYGEACDVERRLFRTLLGTEVAVSHRVVAGDPVCRFLIANRDLRHRGNEESGPSPIRSRRIGPRGTGVSAMDGVTTPTT